jgi:hypothetical protein
MACRRSYNSEGEFEFIECFDSCFNTLPRREASHEEKNIAFLILPLSVPQLKENRWRNNNGITAIIFLNLPACIFRVGDEHFGAIGRFFVPET